MDEEGRRLKKKRERERIGFRFGVLWLFVESETDEGGGIWVARRAGTMDTVV